LIRNCTTIRQKKEFGFAGLPANRKRQWAVSRTILKTEIRDISSLPLEALRRRYQAAFGRPPPPRLSRDLVLRALAYQIQAARFGDLSRSSKKALRRDSDSPVRRRPRTLRSGTQLIREWQGQTHTVDVLEKGFRWRGEHFQSSSAVARAITGSRWSGPRFFGLTKSSSP
jgi:hypothetical protein